MPLEDEAPDATSPSPKRLPLAARSRDGAQSQSENASSEPLRSTEEESFVPSSRSPFRNHNYGLQEAQAKNETLLSSATAIAKLMGKRAGKPSLSDEVSARVVAHVRAMQTELAESNAQTGKRYGCSAPIVGKWLSGTAKPSFDTISDIAKADGIPLDIFLYGHDRMAALVALVDELFRVTPDPKAERRSNAQALRTAIRKLGKKADEHEDAARIGQVLLDSGRVDSVEGWHLLLARIEEIEISIAVKLEGGEFPWKAAVAAARGLHDRDEPEHTVEPIAEVKNINRRRKR